MIRVPGRITREWVEQRRISKFEEWTGVAIGIRPMMIAWITENYRPKGIPYDMSYEGEKPPEPFLRIRTR